MKHANTSITTDKPPATPKSTSMPEPLTHYHPDDDPKTVYRVVGTQDSVTLLQVTRNGRRTSTGEITRVTEEELENRFTETRNPDTNLNPLKTLRGIIQGLAWMPHATWYRFR